MWNQPFVVGIADRSDRCRDTGVVEPVAVADRGVLAAGVAVVAGFYERYGFQRAVGGGRLRLLARVKDLRQTFGA